MISGSKGRMLGLFDRVICRVRGHEFSAWTSVSPGSCEQRRTCMRDGTEERRPHDLGKWEFREVEGWKVVHGVQTDYRWTWEESTCRVCGHLEKRGKQEWWR